MTREEFNTLVNEIGTCEDEAERREKLTSLREEMCEKLDTLESLEEEKKKLSDDNEELRKANMKLFLRVGADDHNEPEPEPTPKDKLNFEDLFNDKGGLK